MTILLSAAAILVKHKQTQAHSHVIYKPTVHGTTPVVLDLLAYQLPFDIQRPVPLAIIHAVCAWLPGKANIAERSPRHTRRIWSMHRSRCFPWSRWHMYVIPDLSGTFCAPFPGYWTVISWSKDVFFCVVHWILQIYRFHCMLTQTYFRHILVPPHGGEPYFPKTRRRRRCQISRLWILNWCHSHPHPRPTKLLGPSRKIFLGGTLSY